jgi:hypothetical protein
MRAAHRRGDLALLAGPNLAERPRRGLQHLSLGVGGANLQPLDVEAPLPLTPLRAAAAATATATMSVAVIGVEAYATCPGGGYQLRGRARIDIRDQGPVLALAGLAPHLAADTSNSRLITCVRCGRQLRRDARLGRVLAHRER